MQLEVPGETPRYRLLLAHRSGMKKVSHVRHLS
jgi:hypothetical protein